MKCDVENGTQRSENSIKRMKGDQVGHGILVSAKTVQI